MYVPIKLTRFDIDKLNLVIFDLKTIAVIHLVNSIGRLFRYQLGIISNRLSTYLALITMTLNFGVIHMLYSICV